MTNQQTQFYRTLIIYFPLNTGCPILTCSSTTYITWSRTLGRTTYINCDFTCSPYNNHLTTISPSLSLSRTHYRYHHHHRNPLSFSLLLLLYPHQLRPTWISSLSDKTNSDHIQNFEPVKHPQLNGHFSLPSAQKAGFNLMTKNVLES